MHYDHAFEILLVKRVYFGCGLTNSSKRLNILVAENVLARHDIVRKMLLIIN